MPDDLTRPLPLDALAAIVGEGHISTDTAELALFSEDIWARGGRAGAIVRPADTEQTARAVAAATGAGLAVVARGGGMSYTGGYTPDRPGAVVIDLRRMNRVLEVCARDMTVTAEAGATWADLLAALKPHGLRTPFWGPLSGISSTLGGGLSQNNAFFGAGTHGPTAESVVALAVVTADGAVIRTGSAGQAGARPFFRHYGPDLAGLFLGDCGAFGIKTEVTFRLIPAPEHEGWVSFSFGDWPGWMEALSEMGRTGLASELCGFDPALARTRMKRASLLADVRALGGVIAGQKSLLDGLKEGAKVALAGRGFLEEGEHSLHAVVEGPARAGVEHGLDTLRAIARRHGGREVENTIPKVMRANPFTPLNNVLGPEGERWVPVHGIVAHSRAAATFAALEALFARLAPEFEAHGVTTGCLTTVLSTNSVLIEPVFFWPDERFGLHDATVEPSMLARLPRRPANPDAAALVARARGQVTEVFVAEGGAHFQIGRAYPWLETRSPPLAALARAIKAHLDPHGLMNPGAAGF